MPEKHLKDGCFEGHGKLKPDSGVQILWLAICVSRLGLLYQSTIDWWLKPQKCIFLHFWRLRSPRVKVLARKASWLEEVATILLCDHMTSSLCVVVRGGDPGWLMTSYNPNDFLKAQLQIQSHWG